MLKNLTIKNFALIESLETEFHSGFSVMTGETGAGKSIILGALSLILGQRADLQPLKNKTEKCIVEGVFDTSSYDLKNYFENNSLDFDPNATILRREILPTGKSRAFINDTPVGLGQLKELANQLIDIHSQNSVLLLQDASFQLNVLDAFCGNAEILKEYKQLFRLYKNQVVELELLRQKENQARSEQDFYQFQFDELNKAALKPEEQKEIEEELGILNHAEEIKTGLFDIAQLMEGEHGLKTVYGEIISSFKPLKRFSPELSEAFNRIESNFLDMEDVAADLAKISDRVEVDPARLEELTERANLIYHLQSKHRVPDVESLIKIKTEYAQKINDFSSLVDQIADAEKELKAILAKLMKMAVTLSEIRKKAKPILEQKLRETIMQLGMPDARVILDVQTAADLSETGSDKVTFLFNANKGGELMEMSKVASGGELSRLMLAIKSQLAASNLVSTIIFDEIDSGVSGEVAGKMAGIMQTLGKKLQVLAITHLPQIASKGSHHYLVKKETGESTTSTSVKLLSQPERIIEIAKMLSDATISNSALLTAEELMKN